MKKAFQMEHGIRGDMLSITVHNEFTVYYINISGFYMHKLTTYQLFHGGK